MLVETICVDEDMANTYVVSTGNQAVIIDPANDPGLIFKTVGNREVVGIFLTHGHYDHFRTLREVIAKYKVKCYLHKNAFRKLSDPSSSYANFFGEDHGFALESSLFTFVNDNEEVTLGPFQIKVWVTKGHTDCSIVFFIGEALFAGDTLFYRTVGRTDLATSNSLSLATSIKRLMGLLHNYTVYPGHGYATSIDDERLNNSFYLTIK